MTDDLSKLVYGEAKKSGVSTAEATKALNMIKKGKISMADISSKLQSSFQDLGGAPKDPKTRLRELLKSKKSDRLSKNSKECAYEKMRENVLAKKEKAQEEKILAKKRLVTEQLNHTKRLNEIEEKMGIISEDLYNELMKRYYSKDNSQSESDKNIIDLYCRQNKFSDNVEFDEIDAILEE